MLQASLDLLGSVPISSIDTYRCNTSLFSRLACFLLLISFFSAQSSPVAALSNNASEPAACPAVLSKPSSGQVARIVGGTLSEDSLSSYLVSFHLNGCAATLISPRWAITATHCAVTTSSVATLGGSSSSNGIKVGIKAVHTHPAHDFPKNDITLIEFAADAPASSNYMLVNDNPEIPTLGEFARVAGYGHFAEDSDENTDNLLYQVDLPIVSAKICKAGMEREDWYLAAGIDKNVHLCAGYKRGKCDSCLGDSGGPLFLYSTSGRLMQIGLVSFGSGCAKPGVAGGYSRVSPYIDWMRKVGAVFEVGSERRAVFTEEGSGYSQGDKNPGASDSIDSKPGDLSAEGLLADDGAEDGDSGGANVGVIVGGVAGLLVVVVAAAVGLLLFWRRRSGVTNSTISTTTEARESCEVLNA